MPQYRFKIEGSSYINDTVSAPNMDEAIKEIQRNHTYKVKSDRAIVIEIVREDG